MQKKITFISWTISLMSNLDTNISKESNKKTVLIYGKNNHTSTSENIVVTPEDLKIQNEFEILKKTIKTLQHLEASNINDRSFLSCFQYDDFSMWWFLRPSLITPFKDTINFIDRFEELIKEKKPTQIKMVGDFSKLKIIEQICKKNNVEFSYSKYDNFKFNLNRSTRLYFQKERFKQIFNKKFNSRLRISKSQKVLNHTNDDSIIFAIPTSYRRSVFEYTTKKSTRGEYIQGNLISILKQLNYKISCIDLDYDFRGEPEILKERIQEGNWKSLESLIDNTSNSNHKDFLKKFKKVLVDKNFQTLFHYHDINMWSVLEEHFLILSYRPTLPWYLQVIDSLFNYFKNNKPLAVFLPYEKGPLALAFTIACERHNIKTFGIQHGVFLQITADYTSQIFRSKDNPLGMPLPDKILLFGEFTKQLLTQDGDHPPDKLIVLGNPAFYNLDNIINNLKKRDLRLKYNIPLDKKIILFATGKNQQYYRKEIGQNYDEKVLEHLLINLPDELNLHVIIKPHPNEKNVDIYKKLIQEHNRNEFSIMQGSTYEFLLLADVFCSVYSTSIIDSITLGTPSIGIKFDNYDYLSLVEKMQVAITCPLDSLSKKIIQVLTDQNLLKQLNFQREEFIKFVYNYPNADTELQLEKLMNFN